jgi:hypothetical protein
MIAPGLDVNLDHELNRGRQSCDQVTQSDSVGLDAFRHLHGAVTITSAHRTSQEQACVCIGERGPCAGRPRTVKAKDGRRLTVRGISRHQLGLAIDVRPGTGSVKEFICLHMFAQLNPQFGVHFPLRSHDYPHMEFRLPQVHRTGAPALAVPSCPTSNASTAQSEARALVGGRSNEAPGKSDLT